VIGRALRKRYSEAQRNTLGEFSVFLNGKAFPSYIHLLTYLS